MMNRLLSPTPFCDVYHMEKELDSVSSFPCQRGGKWGSNLENDLESVLHRARKNLENSKG